MKPSVFNLSEGLTVHTVLTMELNNLCISAFSFVPWSWLLIHYHSIFQLKQSSIESIIFCSTALLKNKNL